MSREYLHTLQVICDVNLSERCHKTNVFENSEYYKCVMLPIIHGWLIGTNDKGRSIDICPDCAPYYKSKKKII